MERSGHESKGNRILKTCCGMCIDECGLNVHVEDGKIVKIKEMT